MGRTTEAIFQFNFEGKISRQNPDRHGAIRAAYLARYTSPMPPAPSGATISYGSSFTPAPRLIPGPVIALSVEKCYVQAGCEDQLVLFLAQRRVANVGVTKVILPSQPFDDLGCDAEIEIDSIVARAGC